MSLEEFHLELKQAHVEGDRLSFLRKRIFHGTPFVFDSNEEDFFEFRSIIAEKFEIGYQEVFIVGSAKLGFSYIKDTIFSYDSDIDTVLVNEALFEKYYWEICEYQYQFDKFHYVPSQREVEAYNKFLRYLVKGWMRPDLLPYSFQVKLIKNDWFEFFQSISNGRSCVGDYKVNGGLFKNYKYLERYHLNGINQTYEKLNY